jgi:hypothetical protein
MFSKYSEGVAVYSHYHSLANNHSCPRKEEFYGLLKGKHITGDSDKDIVKNKLSTEAASLGPVERKYALKKRLFSD